VTLSAAFEQAPTFEPVYAVALPQDTSAPWPEKVKLKDSPAKGSPD
jgi:hypothetical protein